MSSSVAVAAAAASVASAAVIKRWSAIVAIASVSGPLTADCRQLLAIAVLAFTFAAIESCSLALALV